MGCRAGLTPRWVAGLRHGQAAGSRELPGVLGLHLGEKRPQHLPDRVRHLPQQSPPAAPQKSRTKPLQETPAPAQPLRAHLLRLQEGEGKKLLRHVRGGGRHRDAFPRTPSPSPQCLGQAGGQMGLRCPPPRRMGCSPPSHHTASPTSACWGPGAGGQPPQSCRVCVCIGFWGGGHLGRDLARWLLPSPRPSGIHPRTHPFFL